VTRRERIPGMPKTLADAIDDYLAELARRGRKPSTRQRYRDLLNKFADLYEDRRLKDLAAEDCRRFLDHWTDKSAATLAAQITILSGFFDYLEAEGDVKRSPMARITRPPVPRSEDLDVVTVSSADVERLLAACGTWPELLCIVVLIYLGPRLSAASNARRSDLDFDKGTCRFREKGGKTIVKPVPEECLAILKAAESQGVWDGPDAYLIPPERTLRREPRDPKGIYYRVKRIAKAAKVKTHVHSLRAAFAVHYLESHPGDLDALQHLLGHANVQTTRIYLRRQDKHKAMERVRDLRWAGMFAPTADGEPHSSEYTNQEVRLPEPIQTKLAELSEQSRSARKAKA
jgi:integrase